MRRLIAIITPVVGLLFLTWWQTCVGTAALVTLPACSGFDAEPFGQITGVEVLAAPLTEGRGCGQGPDQVYKYVTVVSVPSASVKPGPVQYVAGEYNDCFSNATFQTLCSYIDGDGGTGTLYELNIYAFNYAQWNAVGDAAATAIDTTESPGTSATTCFHDGGAYPPPVITGATWTTTCTASEQLTVPVLANCGVLEVPDSGAVDSGNDAGDASPSDAGPSDAGPG